MMGKASQRKKSPKPGATADAHARIAAEAAAVRATDGRAFQSVEETPALRALLESAIEVMEQSVPAAFEHEGRTYYLRVSIGLARLMVFDTATAPHPIASAVSGRLDEFGHRPYH